MIQILYTLTISLILGQSVIAAQTNRPNIILIMCDDLGWGDTGFNGNADIQTPYLDQLAQQGIVFDRFYSAGSVCSPTRASVLTGRHPSRMGIYHANVGHLKAQELTLPELLKEEGYTTGHFGKWHLGTLTTMLQEANRAHPRDFSHFSVPSMNGYDYYLATESKTPTYDPMIAPTTFDTINGESLRYGWAAIEGPEDKRAIRSYNTFYWKGPEEMELSNVDGDDSRIIMDRVIPFIRRAKAAQQPFFSTIWFHTPHLPVVTSSKYRDLYSNRSHREQLLYGSITAMDEQIGRLWENLQAMGIADNTILWFCSDNGPEVKTPGSSGPFRGRKRDLYEGGIRVPAFCVWPNGLEGGKRINAPLYTSDYLPTLLAILNKEYPMDRPLDGINAWPLVTGKIALRDQAMGFLFRQSQSWVTDNYKLISHDAGKTFELYDLINDRQEQKDLALSAPEIAKSLQGDLKRWIHSVQLSDRGEDY